MSFKGCFGSTVLEYIHLIVVRDYKLEIIIILEDRPVIILKGLIGGGVKISLKTKTN